jgi:hypothetical protein
MNILDGPSVSWEQILAFARSLEDAAFHDNVRPQDGARLVRQLLRFEKRIVGDLHERRSNGTTTPGVKS